MPKPKRDKINIEKIGRLVSNTMFASVPFVLLSPLMPSKGLFLLLLVGIPVGGLLAVAVYVDVCHKKFEK